MQDLPCKLPLPQTWVEEAKSFPHGSWGITDARVPHSLSKTWGAQLNLLPGISDIFQHILKYSQHTILDVSDPNIQPGDLRLPAWVNVAIYRLLCLRPLQAICEEDHEAAVVVSESCRLALLLYLAPIWLFYGAHPVHTEVLVRKQYEILSATTKALRWEQDLWELQLWILCMSSFEAARLPDGDIRNWFVRAVADLCNDEIDLFETLRSVLWIPLLFDQQLEDLRRDVEVLRRGSWIRSTD